MLPVDVTMVLTPDEVGRLRAGYVSADMVAVASAALSTRYAGSAEVVGAINEHVYGRTVLDARSRELCLLAMFAAQESRLALAIHIYWALMEGVSPSEIAETLFLAGVYSGMNRFGGAVFVMRETFALLKRSASGPGERALAAILDRIVERFA